MSKLPGIIILFLVASVGGYYLWQFGVDAASTFTADHPSFQADLKNTLDLQAGVGKPTFTRATVATVTDFEGLIKNVKSGEARFEGARRVENFVTNSENMTSGKTLISATAPSASAVSFQASGSASIDSREKFNDTTAVGKTFVVSVELSGTPGDLVQLQVIDNTTFVKTIGYITLTSNYIRYSVKRTVAAGAGGVYSLIQNGNSLAKTINVRNWQLEEVTGQSNQNPSEYVSTNVKTSVPYHGANVDGVKYFTTYNGNTVASNVVTEATGAAIPDATLHGYVAEGARTNLVLQSEAFYTSSWTKTRSSTGNATTTSPSGTQTASKLVEDSSVTTTHIISQGYSKAASAIQYTTSFYAKAAGRNWILFQANDGTSVSNTSFDIGNGIVGTQTVSGTFTNQSASITAVGGGWYRCSVTYTTPATVANSQIFYMATGNGSGAVTYTGDGTSGIYLWGTQLEAGAFTSSYIPTTSASVTRNADVLKYPTSGNFDFSQGSVLYDSVDRINGSLSLLPAWLGGSYVFADFSVGNGGVLYHHLAGLGYNSYDSTTYSVHTSELPNALSTIKRRGASFGSGNRKLFVAGSASGNVAFDGTFGEGQYIFIGSWNGALQNYICIRNVKIWKKALTDTQLTNMTSTNSAVSQSAVKKTTVGADGSSFQADLKNTLDLQAGVGKPTFTRATIATVTDFEGLIKNVKSGEARFEGARRVENLVTGNSNAMSGWSKDASGAGSVPVVTNNYAAAPDGTITATRIQLALNGGSVGTDWSRIFQNPGAFASRRYSVWIKTTDGSTKVIYLRNNGGDVAALSVTGTWTRYTSLATPSSVDVGIYLRGGFGTSDSADILVWGNMIEDVTGQSNQNPSEYVSVGVKTPAPYHGANVDGVKYFTTYNGNTVASNVVTEAIGAPIPDATLHGYVAEGARTNVLTNSATFQPIGGGPVYGTYAVDQTAPDGTVSASRVLTVSSREFKEYTVANTTYTFSFYIKKVSGSSSMSIRMKDRASDTVRGTTSFTTTTEWQRVSVTGTVAGASAGVRIELSGFSVDDIYWGAQLEAGSFASSYIPTTSASVTRNADVLTYPFANNAKATIGSAYAEPHTYWSAPSDSLVRNVLGFYYNWGSQGVISSINVPSVYISSSDTAFNSLLLSGLSSMYTGVRRRGVSWSGSTKTLFADSLKTSGAFSGNTGSLAIGIGNSGDGVLQWDGTIRNVKIWKKALTDAQLTNMTSTNASVSQSAVKKTIVNASQNTKFTSGLVGLWSFNGTDISGTTVYDRSGQGNNGTTVGGVTKTIGKVGQGLLFDGVNDYIVIPDSDILDAGTGSFTFGSFFKTSVTASNMRLISKRPVGGAPFIGYEVGLYSSGKVFCTIDDDTATYLEIDSVSSFNDGSWHQVFCVIDREMGVLKMYVDGSNVSTTVISGTNNLNLYATLSNTSNLFLGRFAVGSPFQYFTGSIDEVRIYNRALSAGEVKQLHNLGR